MASRDDDDVAVMGAIFYLDVFEPGISAAPIPTFCLDKHEHLGALAWVDGGAGAVFTRCSRQWYGWRTTASAANEIDWARQAGSSPVRLLELTLNNPGNAEFWSMFRGARVNAGERDGKRLARALREWS